MVIDAVLPDANSINSHAAAHLDLRRLEDESLVRRLVYDEMEDWESADLNHLADGRGACAVFKSTSQPRRFSGASMKRADKADDQRRFERIIKKMLATPPTPHKVKKKASKKRLTVRKPV